MDVLASLSFLFIILQISSLTQLRINRKNLSLNSSRLLVLYTSIMIIISIGLLIYGLLSDNNITMLNNDIGKTVDFIQVVGIRLAHITALIESLYRRNEERQFFEHIGEIDRILERSLNIVLDNRQFRAGCFKYGAIILLIYIISELFIIVTRLIFSNQSFWSFWIFYTLPFLVCGIRYFQYFVVIGMIRLRFNKITQILNDVNLMSKPMNNLIETNDVQTTNATTTTATAMTINTIAQIVPLQENAHNYLQRYRHSAENFELKRLLVIRDIYNRLWELCTLVNRMFGLSMLISVGNDFVTIVANCYWIFLNFKDYTAKPLDFVQIIGSAIWSMPHFCNLLIISLLCERAVQSTTNIALGLHRLQVDNLNDNHNTVIEQFSLQLLHQKVDFTAAGFFSINCTLLYTIAGATTTYLIILIQFNMSDQKQH